MIREEKSDDVVRRNRQRLIRAVEAAALVAVSTRTLWRLVSAGHFPAPVRLGRSTRWRLSDIEQWIANGCTDSKNDQE